MNIYGKEEAKYKLNISSLVQNAIVPSSTDWYIYDHFLDGSDNNTIITNIDLAIEPTKIYESSGFKNIETNIEFNDGWNNIYNHETLYSLEVKTYDPPILEFNWTPVEPTILDTIIFSQNHENTRDEDVNKKHGRIDKIKIDFKNDSNLDIDYISKHEYFNKNFSKKEDNIPIKLISEYWDGFEYQSNFIIKYLNMSNIPPVSNWDRIDKGICVPSFDWIATSTDIDDDISNLDYKWELYQNVYGTWNLIDSFNDKNYSYPFQFEGNYKIILETTDLEGATNKKEEIFDILFKECTGSSSEALKGILRLQFGGYQLVALPVAKKVSDLIDLIASKTSLNDSDVVAVCNAAPGIDLSVGVMYNYVPGVTNKGSSNNFDLIMEDNSIKEITAFWIQMKDHPILSYIDIEWDSQTGELK